jgi:hypothetical protein
MKTKLVFALLMWIFIIGSYIKRKSNESYPPAVTATDITVYTPGKDEQAERFEYLLSGRTGKFECETDFSENQTGSVVVDDSEYGNGITAVYCRAGTDKPGYTIKGIKWNFYSESKNKWFNDTAHNYYIRPRIRIPRELIYPRIYELNGENWHTKVCRLEITDTDGKIVLEKEFEGKYFYEKHPDDECRIFYSGNYRDRNSYLNFMDSIITVNGKVLNPSGKINTENTKLDFRVWWYGFCDMWIDCIIINNEVAEDLQNGKYDNWLKSMNDISIEDIQPAEMPLSRRIFINSLVQRYYIVNSLNQ